MTKRVFYEKIGGKYFPVAEYDRDYCESFPRGAHLVICEPGSTSRRFNIDPNYAALIAAGTVAEKVICAELIKSSDLRPSKTPLTAEQQAAWKNLEEAFGNGVHLLEWPSAREAAQRAVSAMMTEAERTMKVPAVKHAYEQFLTVYKLCYEEMPA